MLRHVRHCKANAASYFSTVTLIGACVRTLSVRPGRAALTGIRSPFIAAAVPPAAPMPLPIAAPLPPPRIAPMIAPPMAAPPIFAELWPAGDSPSR